MRRKLTNKKSKLGQMEIMGLVIIMILIMIGVLFAIYFVFQKPSSDLATSFKESQLTANMLNTMLGVTTDCHDASMTQLLQDCAATASIRCPNNLNSCRYADVILGTIFNKTLTAWKRTFHFSISGSAGVASLEQGSECRGEFESKSRPIPISGGGTIVLKLNLCR